MSYLRSAIEDNATALESLSLFSLSLMARAGLHKFCMSPALNGGSRLQSPIGLKKVIFAQKRSKQEQIQTEAIKQNIWHLQYTIKQLCLLFLQTSLTKTYICTQKCNPQTQTPNNFFPRNRYWNSLLVSAFESFPSPHSNTRCQRDRIEAYKKISQIKSHGQVYTFIGEI